MSQNHDTPFRINHKEKAIFFWRRYSPLMMHAKMVEKLKEEYPGYIIVPPGEFHPKKG